MFDKSCTFGISWIFHIWHNLHFAYYAFSHILHNFAYFPFFCKFDISLHVFTFWIFCTFCIHCIPSYFAWVTDTYGKWIPPTTTTPPSMHFDQGWEYRSKREILNVSTVSKSIEYPTYNIEFLYFWFFLCFSAKKVVFKVKNKHFRKFKSPRLSLPTPLLRNNSSKKSLKKVIKKIP